MSELFDRIDALVASRSALPLPAERKRLRQAHGLTLDEVASALDVRRATVSGWEAGRTEPRPPEREAYARLLAKLAELYPAGSNAAAPVEGTLVSRTVAGAPAPACAVQAQPGPADPAIEAAAVTATGHPRPRRPLRSRPRPTPRGPSRPRPPPLPPAPPSRLRPPCPRLQLRPPCPRPQLRLPRPVRRRPAGRCRRRRVVPAPGRRRRRRVAPARGKPPRQPPWQRLRQRLRRRFRRPPRRAAPIRGSRTARWPSSTSTPTARCRHTAPADWSWTYPRRRSRPWWTGRSRKPDSGPRNSPGPARTPTRCSCLPRPRWSATACPSRSRRTSGSPDGSRRTTTSSSSWPARNGS